MTLHAQLARVEELGAGLVRSASRYTFSMLRSVAGDLRRESMTAVAMLSPRQRLERAFQLADEDVHLLCAARGVPSETAVSIVRRMRRHGRIRSACVESAAE
jgi:hypothetical protein